MIVNELAAEECSMHTCFSINYSNNCDVSHIKVFRKNCLLKCIKFFQEAHGWLKYEFLLFAVHTFCTTKLSHRI